MNSQMFYTGVVEDILDPLMLGRVRVRVVGVHTEHKGLLPTESLPWATPIMPVTSASISGIGTSATGLVCGSWVIVFFTDGESMQQPMVMGSIAGVPTSELNTYEGDEVPIVKSSSFVDSGIIPKDLLPPEMQKVGDLVSFLSGGMVGSLLGGNIGELLGKDPIGALLGNLGLDVSGLIPGLGGLLGGIGNIGGSIGGLLDGIGDGIGNIGGSVGGLVGNLIPQQGTPGAPLPAAQSVAITPQQQTAIATSIKTSSENPVKWTLGQTSAEFESGGRGPGTINDYMNTASWDKGGASYGTYQLASYLPAQIPLDAKSNAGQYREKRRPSPLEEYIASSTFKSRFAGLTPATPEFDAKWLETAKLWPSGFQEDQHNYIKKKYYDPVITKLKSRGFNFDNNGPAVQDAIWSTSVQFWHGVTINIISQALNSRNAISDADFVKRMYAVKLTKFPSNTGRIKAEEQKLLGLVTSGATKDNLITSVSTADGTKGNTDFRNYPSVDPQSPGDFDTQTQNTLQIAMSNVLGFTDPNGIYPLKKYLNEPDTNRLARNYKINETIVQSKSNSRVSGVVIANGGGSWEQPNIPYAAQYPHNHVRQTESGHVVELDDTAGGERIHVYHKMGTFVEIDNNGTMVRKIVGDNYEIIERNGNIYIGGQCNLTVSGSINIYAYGETNVESEGDVTVIGHNDISVTATGNMDLVSAETLTMKANKIVIDSDTQIDVLAKTDYNISIDNDINQMSRDYNLKMANDYQLAAIGEIKQWTKKDFSITGTNIYADSDIENGGLISYNHDKSIADDFVSVEAIGPEFGVPTTERRDVSTFKLEPLTPTTRIDNSGFFFETEEETTNSMEYEAYKNSMIVSGNATHKDFSRVPVIEKHEGGGGSVGKVLVPVDSESIDSIQSFPNNMKLSPNFTLGQVSSNAVVSKYPVRAQFGITAADAVKNLQNLCLNALEPIKAAYPNMFVTSGFRHTNSGSRVSDHVLGQAVDLQFKGASKAQYFEIAQRIKKIAPFKQLLLEYKSTGTGMPWIHISLSRTGSQNKNSIMTFYNHKKYSDGLSKLA